MGKPIIYIYAAFNGKITNKWLMSPKSMIFSKGEKPIIFQEMGDFPN
jgi:hypothetical protein